MSTMPAVPSSPFATLSKNSFRAAPMHASSIPAYRPSLMSCLFDQGRPRHQYIRVQEPQGGPLKPSVSIKIGSRAASIAERTHELLIPQRKKEGKAASR